MNPVATGISSLGTALGIPNLGISQAIAGSSTPVPSIFGVSNAPYSPVGLNSYPSYQSNPMTTTPTNNSPTQSVQGATTKTTTTPTTTQTGGGSGGTFQPGQNGYVNPNTGNNNTNQAPSDPYAGLRDALVSSYNDASTQLGNSATAQNGIADTALTQGQQTINAQKAASLKDIANTTRNAFQAGNNYLGSLGAGDSSAANQYAFAINQQAGKQTGDLNNYVNTQLNTLQNQHDTQINSIAQWLAGQQSQLSQAKGQNVAALGEQALNQALAAVAQVKQNTQNQYNALLSWAANNSNSVSSLQSNIAAIPQAMGQISLMGGSPANNSPYYAGSSSNTNTNIFGQPITQ